MTYVKKREVRVEFICWKGYNETIYTEYWDKGKQLDAAVAIWLVPQKHFCTGEHMVKKYNAPVEK
jgi:hypothetical protein